MAPCAGARGLCRRQRRGVEAWTGTPAPGRAPVFLWQREPLAPEPRIPAPAASVTPVGGALLTGPPFSWLRAGPAWGLLPQRQAVPTLAQGPQLERLPRRLRGRPGRKAHTTGTRGCRPGSVCSHGGERTPGGATALGSGWQFPGVSAVTATRRAADFSPDACRTRRYRRWPLGDEKDLSLSCVQCAQFKMML